MVGRDGICASLHPVDNSVLRCPSARKSKEGRKKRERMRKNLERIRKDLEILIRDDAEGTAGCGIV
jgi:hypothetical protein